MWKSIRLFLLVFLLIQSRLSGQSPDPTPPNQPKIGLVLSGGGAKGLAHIGVLKVMEELGIRPDFITGTSMGAIVGGLYAAGYSAEELEKIVRELDWELMLSDQLPHNDVILEQKNLYSNELITLPIGKGFQFKLPEAIIQGQELELALKDYTLPVYDIDDFHDLPIPFLCIATDIKHGKKIEQTTGNLAEAMRASMAIPAFFTPVVQDSMILIDGGTINNFPVDEAIDMGADVVIGVNVASVEADDDYYLSPLGQIFEAGMLASKQQFPRQRDLCDAFFQVSLGEISAADFQDYDTIMALGEKIIREEIHKLEDLIEKYQLEAKPPENKSRIQNLVEFRVDSMEVTGNSTYSAAEILGALDLDPGRYINREELILRIRRLSGSNFYDKVTYTLYQQDEKNHLRINVKEKPPGDVKFSIIFDNYHKAGILLALSSRNPFWQNSRFRLVGKISDNYEFGLQFSQYLNPVNSLMLHGEATFHRENLRLFWNGLDFGLTPQLNLPISVQFGWRMAPNAMFTVGGRFENRRFNVGTNEEENALIRVKALRMNNLIGQLALEVNTLDNIHMPRSGWKVDARFQYISNSQRSFVDLDTSSLGNSLDDIFFVQPYPRVHFYFNYYCTLRQIERLQVALNGMALINWAEANSIVDYFYLGGSESLTEYSVPMAGYQVNNIPVYAAFGLGFDVRYFILEDLSAHLRNSWTFASFPDVLITRPGIPGPISFLSGLSFGGTYDSFLGPVSIDFNFPLLNDIPFDTDFSIYLHFGYRF